MIHEDLFVGLVAVALGSIGLAAAALNWEHFFRIAKVQWIEVRVGRSVVRVGYALIGILLIVLGAAIALGFSPNAQQKTQSTLRLGIFTGADSQPQNVGRSIARRVRNVLGSTRIAADSLRC